MMLKRTAVFAFVFACLCNAATFTTTHGKLSVSGGKILNSSGQEVVLRGMSLYWYNGPWGGGQPGNQFYTSQVVSDAANNWNASVVRAAIGNVQQSPNDALDMAKKMMGWAKDAGVYVIIDNHSHIAHRSGHATAAQTFFSAVSEEARSKGYTHVIYEIYNEPVCDWDQPNNNSCASNQKTTWAQIKSYAVPVINSIRANDPDGLIIVGTPGFSSNVTAARNDPISGKNILYALHFYAGESSHSNYRISLESAYCNDFPVFVSEWGTSPGSGNGAINISNSNTWLSLLEAAKVSNANWSLSNTSETSAALTSTSVTGGLTESGTYVKNILKLNTGATLSSVGLTQQTINCSSTGPTGPSGTVQYGTSSLLSNSLNIEGADTSSTPFGGAALVNSSATFTADYNIIDLPQPGSYLVRFYSGSTAGGTVTWSGAGIVEGSAEIPNTGSLSTYKYSDLKRIDISEAPTTPLYLSFETPSANSLKAIFIEIRMAANEEDSLLYGITSIHNNLANSKLRWDYNSITGTFNFESNRGSLAIYNLKGERKIFFNVNGSFSLKEKLPSGVYIAIYKNGSETAKKTIHLK